jgi:5'-nucleotidase
MVIYLDMDGVLVDFDSAFKQLFGMSPKEGFSKIGDEKVYQKMNDTSHFWKHMNWKEGGKLLWEFFKDKDVKILTSPAKTVEECQQDKIDWCKSHLGDNVEVIFSHSKGDYANENSILIDDMKDNIDSFNSNNGHGILHKSAQDSIEQYQKIVGKKAMNSSLETPVLTDRLVTDFISYFYAESDTLAINNLYILKACTIPTDIIQMMVSAITGDPSTEITSDITTELIESLLPEIEYFEVGSSDDPNTTMIQYVEKQDALAI